MNIILPVVIGIFLFTYIVGIIILILKEKGDDRDDEWKNKGDKCF